MRSSRLLYLVLLGLSLGGCDHDEYQVEITPQGKSYERKLTAWHTPDDKAVKRLSDDERSRIDALYPVDGRSFDGEKSVYVGRFAGQTPSDVGGAGSYTHFTSPLGDAAWYIERFRGSDDAAAQLATRHQAADRVADTLIGWFSAEMAEEPDFPKLKQFLDGDFRHDLHNLATYMWLGQAMSERKSNSFDEMLARLAQYAVERGYATPADGPDLLRGIKTQNLSPIIRRIQRLAARKMGVADDQPAPRSLAFLGDESRAKASLARYAEGLQEAHAASEGSAAPAATPDSTEAKRDLLRADLDEMTGFTLEDDDSLAVKLHCATQPYTTNGTWDESAAVVTWESTALNEKSLPIICFAKWSEPNAAFQQTHFGRVLLSGDDLGAYVVWYVALTDAEAEEWNAFVGRLRPGSELKAAVKAFRFAADPKPDSAKPNDNPSSLADEPRRLIVAALEKDEGQ